MDDNSKPDVNEKPPLLLSPADAAAFDALLDGTDGQTDAARQARAAQWLALLQTSPAAEPSGTLAARTLARVKREAAPVPVLKFHPAPRPSRWDFFRTRRFAEGAAIAAVVAIMGSVLVPMLGHARAQAQQTACASNLTQFADAMGQYATDHSKTLPELAVQGSNWLPRYDVTPAGTPGGADVSAVEHSNNANLLPLVRESYAKPDLLPCPAANVSVASFDPARAVDIPEGIRGYSYVNLFGQVKPQWNSQPNVVVLADRNPMFGAGGGEGNLHANSINHGGRGNNVMFADGHVQWLTSPDLAGADGTSDNIWTPCNLSTSHLRGTEAVTMAGDSFVAP